MSQLIYHIVERNTLISKTFLYILQFSDEKRGYLRSTWGSTAGDRTSAFHNWRHEIGFPYGCVSSDSEVDNETRPTTSRVIKQKLPSVSA